MREENSNGELSIDFDKYEQRKKKVKKINISQNNPNALKQKIRDESHLLKMLQ